MKSKWSVASVAASGLTALLLLAPSVRAERVEHIQPDAGTDVYVILEPDIAQEIKEYTNITFQPGDRVTVAAGGCCNIWIGGPAPTWRRYVDPIDSASPNLYHGTILIPGAMNYLRRLESVIGQTFTIPVNAGTADLFLRLGFEDIYYLDNGYQNRDQGLGNQCAGLPNAYVILVAQHP